MATHSPYEYDVDKTVEKVLRETTALSTVNQERILALRALAKQACILKKAKLQHELTHASFASSMGSSTSEPSDLGPRPQATRQSNPVRSSESSDSEVGGKSTSIYYDPGDSTDSGDSDAFDIGNRASSVAEFCYTNFYPKAYIQVVENLVTTLRIWLMELEEAKYPAIDFNAPLKKWTRKEKITIRTEIREMSYEIRKKYVLEKMVDLNERRSAMTQIRESRLAVEVIELLLQDIFLLRMIPFKDAVFPVQMENIYDWERVSDAMKGTHNPAECQEVWMTKYHPNVNRKVWSKAENKLLNGLANAYNLHNWDKISKQMHTIRSEFQCFVQYRRFLFKDKPVVLELLQPEIYGKMPEA